MAVGALKVRDPAALERQVRAFARDARYEGRLRWAELATAGKQELIVARRALHLACTSVDCAFACAVIDRSTTDVDALYGSVWQAYNRLAARAIGDVLDHQEVAGVVADRFDAPRGHLVEDPIRGTVNDGKKRLAMSPMQQVASGSVLGVQLADLVLGAVTYQIRETHDPRGEAGPRMALSREVMQEHYQQTSFLRRGPGRLEINRLDITVFPLPRRDRGTRGGGRARNLRS